MADVIYKVRAPDGTILKIQGPEGASEAEINEFASQAYSAPQKGGEDRKSDQLAILQDEYQKVYQRMMVAEEIAINSPTKENKAAYDRLVGDSESIRKELIRIGGEAAIPDVMPEPEAPAQAVTPPSEQDFQAQKARIAADVIGAGAGAALAKGAEMGRHGAQAVSALREIPELLKNVPQGASGPSSGAKWLQNWGGIAKEGFQGGVPEAAGQYNRMKPQGQVMGALGKKGLVPPQPVQPGVFTGGQLSISGQPPAAPAPGPLTQAGGMGKKALGVVTGSPVLSGALGGLSMAESGQEFFNRYKGGDIPGMMISGAGALGGGMQMIPHPASRALGAGLSAASPLTMYLYDKLRAPTPQGPTPQEMELARQPAFVYPRP